MEPYHQLRIDNSKIVDLAAELTRIGCTVSICHGSWLGDSGFVDYICERDGSRTVFAVGIDRSDVSFSLLVYPNMGSDDLASTIRVELERIGAEWGYYDD